MEDRRCKSRLNFITIGAFKYPILTIIASPIVADFQYVVYKYFTQIINMTDILLQFFWGQILYSLDYNCCTQRSTLSFSNLLVVKWHIELTATCFVKTINFAIESSILCVISGRVSD